jgi:hypothetical protein
MRFVGIADANSACVGYLTPENIAEMVMIGSARASRGGPKGGALQPG